MGQLTMGLRDKIPLCVDFYEGRQWPAATENTRNLPRPVVNIIKMICRSKKGAILSTPVKILYRSYSQKTDLERFNSFAKSVMKEYGQEELDRIGIDDAIKKGSCFFHYYWDSETFSQESGETGALSCEVIDPLNIFFANPAEVNEQKQEWIMISSKISKLWERTLPKSIMTEKSVDWKLNVFLMWITQTLVMTGFDASMTFIPLLLRDNFGLVEQAQRGLYVSIFNLAGFLGYAIFCPLWGSLSDRFGVKIMLLRGFFVTCFFFPLMGYVNAPWMLISLRFLTAACAGTTAAANILLVKTVPDNKIGFALGIFGTAFWGGSVMGNVLGGIIVDLWGYKITFWTCGILYFISGIFTLFVRDAPTAEAKENKKEKAPKGRVIPKFSKTVTVMLALLLFYNFVRRFETPYIAMLVELITGPEKAAFWTGIAGACTCIGAMLSGVITGYLADKLKPLTIIIPALALAAVLLLISGLTASFTVLTVARTLMFFFSGSLFAVFQKILTAATPQEERGAVFGWSTTFNNVGGMLSTVFSGWVISLSDARGVFVVAAILTFILLPVTVKGLNFCISRIPSQLNAEIE